MRFAVLLAAGWLDPAMAQILPPPAADPPAQSPRLSDPRRAANTLEQAQRLIGEGQFEAAIAQIDKTDPKNPRHVELAFLRAVALSRAGRTAEAIDAFESLTRQYPDLAEPYNNLAVLYASRDELNRARAALEQAISAQPIYALAHENLGDVLLRLALREYERASRSPGRSASAQRKLELSTELVGRIAPNVGTAPGIESTNKTP